jgi:hypothetical protein
LGGAARGGDLGLRFGEPLLLFRRLNDRRLRSDRALRAASAWFGVVEAPSFRRAAASTWIFAAS